MGWLRKLMGFLFLPGGGQSKQQPGAVVDAVANAVDKAVYTEQEKAQDAEQDLQSARNFIVAPSHSTLWDAFIDGWHRAIRPAFATWAFCVVAGWVRVPAEAWALIPALAWNIILTVIGFYFGGRMLTKDILPAVMAMFRK